MHTCHTNQIYEATFKFNSTGGALWFVVDISGYSAALTHIRARDAAATKPSKEGLVCFVSITAVLEYFL